MNEANKTYHPDLAEEDKDEAVKCECCEVWDLIEIMKSRPEGYYCESCFENIFN